MHELPERVTTGSDLEGAHAAALSAYMHFSEASNLLHDPAALGPLAFEVLEAHLSEVEVAYSEVEGDLIKTRVVSASVPEAVVALIRAGFPRTTPLYARQFAEARALFAEWDAEQQQIPETAAYRGSALYPLWRWGEPFGCLTVAAQDTRPWSQREKLVFMAVGRALQLALERAWQAQERDARLLALERRTHALEVFAEVGRDLALWSDPQALIFQAERLLSALLPSASVRYVAHHEGSWTLDAQLEPSAEPVWDLLPGVDEEATIPVAMVSAPRQNTERQAVMVGGETVGVLEATRPVSSPWTLPDRTVLETVAYQLGLALERADQTDALKQQRLALEKQAGQAQARQLEGEAFSEAVWQDLRRELVGLGGEAERTQPLMARLDALLAYAKVIRRPLHKTRLQLMYLTMLMRDEFTQEVLDRQVEWRIHDLPEVLGDREAVRTVLRELFSNALKFTRDQPAPRIEVWSEEQAEGLTVFVRDNGIGFEPRWAEHLFLPEVRVHEPNFEGYGLGLATVRRLIERHGGRVWAEGRPGEGATVAFTLP